MIKVTRIYCKIKGGLYHATTSILAKDLGHNNYLEPSYDKEHWEYNHKNLPRHNGNDDNDTYNFKANLGDKTKGKRNVDVQHGCVCGNLQKKLDAFQSH